MGEVTMATNGLLPKVISLFNNSLYSDVQFVFKKEDGTCDQIYCHKLILALQSKAFAHIFFGKEISPNKIEMQASKKQLFYVLFKFLYTGDVQFNTLEEAKDLSELANDYFVEELVKRCHNYMLQGRLTIKNVFSRYEYALNGHVEMLLKDCRNFVCSNVQMVLKSVEFTRASPGVVEDIAKLDNLPLSNELEIIEAVLNWGSENLKSNEIPYNGENLRKSIDPFMKHLRFLSLAPPVLIYLVEHYNIFSASESVALIAKIMKPDYNHNLPQNFCSITSRRGAIILSNKTSAKYQQHDVVQPNSPKSERSYPPESLQSDSSKIAYEVKKYSEKHTTVSSEFKKFNSSPNISDIKFPAPNFSQNRLRDFIFPLIKSEKSFTLSFRKDIKCWVVIKMKSGNLLLHGLELKVQNKSEKQEKIEVDVHSQGFSEESFENSYTIELHNNILPVKFPKPMKLSEGGKGKLEISIENLALDRCSQIGKTSYEVNSGLNFECEFCIDSNKKTQGDENFLFLINKLIYVAF